MVHLKLLRSLLLGQSLADPLLLLPHYPQPSPPQPQPLPPPLLPRSSSKSQPKPNQTTIVLVFTPTNEAVTDTYRLAALARDIGLDLNPTPSLSHIIFSAPNSSSQTPTPSSFSSSSLCIPNDAVPLPFPSLYSASTLHLRAFVSLTHPLFKLVKVRKGIESLNLGGLECTTSNWERCGLGLFGRRSGLRVDDMDGFCGAMAGAGWSVFKTSRKSKDEGSTTGLVVVFLFRKVEVNKVGTGRREREVRLPLLDFKNAPSRILQYVVLMTDDVFFLA